MVITAGPVDDRLQKKTHRTKNFIEMVLFCYNTQSLRSVEAHRYFHMKIVLCVCRINDSSLIPISVE